jgi:rhodanese-related sulfurtransferase
MGYTNVHLLAGGLQGWQDAGGEVFRDVNVPSKSFGELVESKRHTPSLSAQEVKALIDAKANVVVLDARRFDEYQTMSIPSGISVPGAELVLRARALAPNATTRIIVNCAGRTRSIIGTQSLINSGIPNPVSALRNGTIGWTLAGQELTKGASDHFPEVDDATRAKAAASAFAVAMRAGVKRVRMDELNTWLADNTRTTYFFDVRTPQEYAAPRPKYRRAATPEGDPHGSD